MKREIQERRTVCQRGSEENAVWSENISDKRMIWKKSVIQY